MTCQAPEPPGTRTPPWEEVLGQHGRTLRTARRAYRQFLDEGLAARVESPLRGAVASTVLGSPEFVARMRAWLEGLEPDREVPALRSLVPTPSLESIEAVVCATYGTQPGELRRRGRHGNDARCVAVALARELTTHSLRELGERFGGVGPAAIANIVRQVSSDRRATRQLWAIRRAVLRQAKTE